MSRNFRAIKSRSRNPGHLLGSTAVILLAAPILPEIALSYLPAQIPLLSTAYAGEPCPPLRRPTSRNVTVSDEEALWRAVAEQASGTTILIADGSYDMARLARQGRYLWFGTPGVTLRSASGNRDAVVLDGAYEGAQIISIAASNVTVADLTIRRPRTHAVHVFSTDTNETRGTRVYNVHIVDSGQQAIKINPHGARRHFADAGLVACSKIELTDHGRPKVWEINGSCYTGGIDAHQAKGWTVRDTVLSGFWCPRGLSEHAIHFWKGSRDTLVERNRMLDNARGIGFGLQQSGESRTYADRPCPRARGHVGHYGGIIRNNVILVDDGRLFASQAAFDSGISLWQACRAKVVHNTVVSTRAPFASIEWRFGNTRAMIANNLLSHNLKDRGGAAKLSRNVENAPLSLFVNAARGDLHLRAEARTAIDRGATLTPGLCRYDMDGDERPSGRAPDVGADEFVRRR